MKVACKRPPETNKFYVEMLSSALREFFGEWSYPLECGMAIKVNQLKMWCTTVHGFSVIAGEVIPYLPGLKNGLRRTSDIRVFIALTIFGTLRIK